MLRTPSSGDQKRCTAILSPKYIAGEHRCSRKARVYGLCLQHARVPARVPARWVRDGAGVPRPEGQIVTVKP